MDGETTQGVGVNWFPPVVVDVDGVATQGVGAYRFPHDPAYVAYGRNHPATGDCLIEAGANPGRDDATYMEHDGVVEPITFWSLVRDASCETW